MGRSVKLHNGDSHDLTQEHEDEAQVLEHRVAPYPDGRKRSRRQLGGAIRAGARGIELSPVEEASDRLANAALTARLLPKPVPADTFNAAGVAVLPGSEG